MPHRDTSFGSPRNERGEHCALRIFSIVTVSLLVAAGCGLGDTASRSSASVQIIWGKDSAGATIELEKSGDDLTAARVIDGVLGTGESEIIPTMDGGVEFTIEFPAGATITYVGRPAEDGALHDITVTGTWLQHPRGVFGADSGTWRVPASPATDDLR